VNDQIISTTNVSLDAYLSANSARESDEILAVLFESVIDPHIRSLVRSKLRATLRRDDDCSVNQDALDLIGDIRALLLRKLAAVRSAPGQNQIADLGAYVRTVAENSINHYLRRKHPRRLRLKNQLRYLLSHDRRFALWTNADGERVCAAAGNENRAADERPMSSAQLFELSATSLKTARVPVEKLNIGDVVTLVFAGVNGVVRFRDLVSALYDHLRIEEPAEVAEDAGHHIAHPDLALQQRLEEGVFLKQIWDAIGELPVRHRAALLLNLRDRNGDGLIALLPVTRVASIAEIARRLEFPLERFGEIWPELPWDDNRIAEHLGLTRQQVINLRQSARSTLRRRLNF
jgi:RNA polymerase sigma factor (sigma-70 family)